MTPCTHCGADPRRYADGLCTACHVYELKYRKRPPANVLVLRQRRRDRRRFEREGSARCLTDGGITRSSVSAVSVGMTRLLERLAR